MDATQTTHDLCVAVAKTMCHCHPHFKKLGIVDPVCNCKKWAAAMEAAMGRMPQVRRRRLELLEAALKQYATFFGAKTEAAARKAWTSDKYGSLARGVLGYSV